MGHFVKFLWTSQDMYMNFDELHSKRTTFELPDKNCVGVFYSF